MSYAFHPTTEAEHLISIAEEFKIVPKRSTSAIIQRRNISIFKEAQIKRIAVTMNE